MMDDIHEGGGLKLCGRRACNGTTAKSVSLSRIAAWRCLTSFVEDGF